MVDSKADQMDAQQRSILNSILDASKAELVRLANEGERANHVVVIEKHVEGGWGYVICSNLEFIRAAEASKVDATLIDKVNEGPPPGRFRVAFMEDGYTWVLSVETKNLGIPTIQAGVSN